MPLFKPIKTTLRLLAYYLLSSGLIINLLAVAGYFFDRALIYKIAEKAEEKTKLTLDPNALIKEQDRHQQQLVKDIAANFGPWQPLVGSGQIQPYTIHVADNIYLSLASASAALQDHQVMVIGEGVYNEPLVVSRNHVQIIGRGHVVFEGVAAEGKAALVIKGQQVTISNIECRNISVPDQNGACVRLENTGLTINHVYFHDSEQGLLSGGDYRVQISDSRFERLGKNGRAHGIYLGGGDVVVDHCLFLAAVSQGHEIKSRARKTVITHSVIASLAGDDSRLVDVPNGGELRIENSVLEKGPYSANATAIGYGLEGITHTQNHITLKKNVVILEREGFNVLLDARAERPFTVQIAGNVLISKDPVGVTGLNGLFASREEAKMAAYPTLPVLEKP